MKSAYQFFILLVLQLCLSIANAENFPRPADLQADVDFWVRVYTEADTRSGYIHDAKNLAIVYEQISINRGPRTNKKRIKKAKARYAAILQSLASGKRTGLSTNEQRVLSLWGNATSNQQFRRAAQRLRFQRGQSDRFRRGLIRSGEWRPYIEETLASFDMPRELAVLPHVESSFNPQAYSHVGAAGIWQFIRSTGKRYLRIDHVVDERMDPFASTVAAAKLLKNNYQITQSWPLALTAYNHGVASMRRAINKLGTRDITTIVRQYKGRSFGFASRNFYVAFLAALEVDSNPQRYFSTLTLNQPVEYDYVTLDAYYAASDIANYLGLPKPQLQQHNRALRDSVWSGSKRMPVGFRLRVPTTLIDRPAKQLIAAMPSALHYKKQTPDEFHYVKRGDTLSEIADYYGYKVQDIMQVNNLSRARYIRAGQKLRLPVAGRTPEKTLAKKQSVAKTQNKNANKQTNKVIPPSKEAEPKADNKTVANDSIESISDVVDNTSNDVVQLGEGSEKSSSISTTARSEEIDREKINEEIIKPASIDSGSMASEAPLQEEATELDVNIVAEPELKEQAALALLTDPADYTVAKDNSIEVQASETLGHYAEWLDLRASRLRKINHMKFAKPVVVGKRITLDFTRVAPTEFEQRRITFQKQLQDAFFAQYRIDSTYQHTIRSGESLWVLALRQFKVPVWLLRQHNPDVDFQRIKPGAVIIVPRLIEEKSG